VADLDYSHDGLRRYMIDMMAWWVRDAGIDGFRCDVAEMVPTDFWEAARAELDAIKPVIMLSEGSLPEHHVKAFDITYSWNIYDVLEPLLSGKRPVALIDQILKTEGLQFPRGSLRMRFTTNHDKNAWDAPAVKKFGPEGLQLATVLINTLPGVPLIYTGEEVANDRPLDLFEKVDVDWTRPRAVGEIYRTLFALRAQNSALARGDMVRVTGTAANDVYAFLRTEGKNFAPETRRAKLQMPPVEGAVKGGKVNYREVFNGRNWMVSSAGGEVVLTIEAKGYRVFTAVVD
jgi:glycosidase